jgi:thioredoxin-dependent peroxiredoxin
MNELASLKEAYSEIAARGGVVLGVSADSLRSHELFAAKLGGLPFPLASDGDLETIRAYGVLNDRGTGARRAIFVVDRDGTIVHANPAYKVSDSRHLAAVLDALRNG